MSYDWSNEPRYKTLERVEALYGPEGIAEFRAELDRLAKGPPRIGKERAWFAIRSNPRYFPPEGPGLATLTTIPASTSAREPEASPQTSDAPPWEGLPTNADFDSEVRWVYQQFPLVVETVEGRQSILRWNRATEPPPNTAAIGLMRWAARNETTFYKETVPRAFKDLEGENDEEAVRAERKSIAEIEHILDQMNQEFQRSMIEDTPETLREEVRNTLADWKRTYGGVLSAEALEALDAHVMKLGTRLVAASGGAAV